MSIPKWKTDQKIVVRTETQVFTRLKQEESESVVLYIILNHIFTMIQSLDKESSSTSAMIQDGLKLSLDTRVFN